MKKQPLKYRLNVIGGAIIIFQCVRTYIPIFAQKAGATDNFTLWLMVNMVTLALSCILPVFFIEKMCDCRPALFREKQRNIKGLALVMYSMLIVLAVTVVNSLLFMLFEKTGVVFPKQQLNNTDSTVTLLLYFLYVSVTPAVFEEIFMRGYVLNLLRPYGTRFAIFASAFLFMLMHTQLQSFLPVFVAGILLACIYVYTDNIYMSMLLHFINNGYSFIMTYSVQNSSGVSSAAFAVYILALLMATGIVAEMYLKRKDISVFSPLEKNGEKNAKLRKIWLSPVLVLALLTCFMAVGSQLYIDLGL